MATASAKALLGWERREAVDTALHLAALVDASNDAIISADAKGLITTWNRAAELLYGYAKEEIVGRSIRILCPLDKIGEHDQLLRAVAGGVVSIAFDTHALHKDGSRLDVAVTNSRIMADGALTGFCWVTCDIGARVRSRARLEEELRVGINDLARSRASMLQGLALAAEYRDYETSLHTDRVGSAAADLAARVGLPASVVEMIGEAARLHDVGKIGIPDSILLKPGRLTPDEFQEMKQHTVLGSALLVRSDGELLQLAGQIALTHHEQWSGGGYPAGLSGESIPIAGRIVAVVDTFDAMTHERPYSDPCTAEAALAEIARCSGSRFDPCVVRAFHTPERRAPRPVERALQFA
jgi:PAS domain S-box-containing protein